MSRSDRYHYKECGLDNIYLLNGFDYVETPRGTGVTIKAREGLHQAIALMLLEKRSLNGREFRYLRHELNLTQSNLAGILGMNVQAIARLEKRTIEEDGPAQRLLRLLYSEHIGGNRSISEPLRRLAEIDEILGGDEEDVVFEQLNATWQPTLQAA